MNIKNYDELYGSLRNVLKNEGNLSLLEFLRNLYSELQAVDFYIEDINVWCDLLLRSFSGDAFRSHIQEKHSNIDHEKLFKLFKERDFKPENRYILRDLILGQIGELELGLAGDWSNVKLSDFLEGWMNGLIDHYWKFEDVFNPIVLASMLELWKIYE